MMHCLRSHPAVAPFTGAWIEIAGTLERVAPGPSHPSRVRGLKLHDGVDRRVHGPSHPSRVRGLKSSLVGGKVADLRSHPSRVRGLKCEVLY